METRTRIEWPTIGLIAACYLCWAAGTSFVAVLSLPLGVVFTTLAVALHASLQHEVIHGHPFARQSWNEALVFPALNLLIPYARFRDTHLAHHRDAMLTDPFDDPESNYLTCAQWRAMPRPLRGIFLANNSLIGRMLLGPLISQIVFMRGDWGRMRSGDRDVLRGWALHCGGVVLVLAWLLSVGSLPLWAYGVAVYGALSLIKIRTFAEHRAHEKARGRTVVIEDRGPLAFLFLNNNLHAVHHMHPGVPWYRLPALYAHSKARVLACNEGYVYRSYTQLFVRHLFWRKDEVTHPLWHRD